MAVICDANDPAKYIVAQSKRSVTGRRQSNWRIKSVVGEGKKMCRIIFHLLEVPSALLYTYYVSFTLYITNIPQGG